MAYTSDQEPSGLSTVSTLENNDTVIIGDTSDSNEVVKTISWTNMKTLITSLIEGLTSYYNKTTDTLDDINTGTTNKHFTATDEAKLDAIEANATADQTGAEIKTAYEAEADTNAFTDAEKTKLGTVETNADATDETNVRAAGAPIVSSGAGAPSSTPTALGDIYIDTTNDNAYVAVGTASSADWEISNDGAGGGISDGDKGDVTVSNSGDTWTIDDEAVTNAKLAHVATDTIKGRTTAGTGDVEDMTPAQVRTMLNVEDGATADQTGAEIKTAYEGEADTNAFTDAEQTKLSGIETGATADQTGAEIKTAYEGEADTNAFTDAEQTKLAGIATGAEVNPDVVSQAEAEAGTATTERIFTAQRVAQAIAALADIAAATTSVAGKIKKATSSTINTGTADDEAVTPDALAASNLGTRYYQIRVFAKGTDVATGDDAVGAIHVPAAFDGMNLVSVHAEVDTAGTTGTTDIQIHNVDNALDMLSTKLTIDSGETGSDTAATAAVINASNDHVNTNDVLRIDIDAVSTTAPQGLLVTFGFQLP